MAKKAEKKRKWKVTLERVEQVVTSAEVEVEAANKVEATVEAYKAAEKVKVADWSVIDSQTTDLSVAEVKEV